jgi:4-phytase/acid phosphatase
MNQWLLRAGSFVVLAGAALCQPSLSAQGVSAGKHESTGENRLKLVVILSRHGVRSPTWAMDRLNAYSATAWPAFSVEPGILTSRGYELLKRFGTYDRAEYARKGLLAAEGCADAAKTYVWADTDQRTIASGHALAESLFPGCPLEVHSLAEGANDPVFHSITDGVSPAVADASYAEVSKAVADLPKDTGDLLAQLQRILLGCKPEVDCKPIHPPDSLIEGKTSVARGAGDKFVTLKGPIPLGSTFSEDLLLEYAEGMPMSSVGWGNVDQAELSKLLALHTVYFRLIHQTPAIAKAEASNMLETIAKTLEQGVEGKPMDGAKGKPGDKLVVLAGHDTNIGGIASLLGVHWKLDGREDDTPPGTEISFELWQDALGRYSVKVAMAMQTLHQLRELQALTPADPPASQPVTPRGCSESNSSCSWQQFLELSNSVTR